MVSLVKKLNYRNVNLDAGTLGESVGVYLKGGGVRFLRFTGFIELRDAKAMGATPVRLEICAYYPEGIGSGRIELQETEFIQGAILGNSVAAVLHGGKPRIVTINR